MKKLLVCLALLTISSVAANSNIQYVNTMLKERPLLLNKLTKKASLVKRNGKNYLHTIFDNKGREKVVKTMGKEFVYAKLANSLEYFSHRKNQLNLYKLLYAKLPKKYLRSRLIRTPRSLERKDVTIITKAIFRLTRDIASISKLIRPYNAITTTAKENRCGPHPDGIIKNLNIPMSYSYKKGHTQIWNIFNTDFSAAIAKLASTLKLPMKLSLPINPSFDKAPVNGYVQYLGSHEENRGGHTVLVLAVVENKNLPATAPRGPGGGYFVVKNSWGNCWKDAGHIYLPITWVKTYAHSLTVATLI
ncbi:MAG: hypothetical protein DRQ88_11945 [Epsilonproteobacteria bacterium]|nr:MAG: hypothetical protein DRQ88_11945 [Campylobacterota bacterium]RLA65794.1 MAG: hypothetical protein DRQ89_00120 [Campylobacterota bacterium]